ncbi:hypothetical protein KP509_14G032300 [Ceratopteris richardii]|uniref:Uncharacterized protein n=1 Tax=Ceratopteris richardii TaxID=49495 RepID=A0A8T2T6V7_CERRI|nr:hypothetical protein KP509_14G032300 [Ceratopteris richardii]
MAIDECVREIDDCRDKPYATDLRLGAIATILAACILGICMPLLGRYLPAFHADSNLFFVMKSFAAGVILATAYLHMLPESFESLSNPCLSENPWAKFPFAGFISMLATLLVLLIEFSATTFYENKKHARRSLRSAAMAPEPINELKIKRSVASVDDTCKSSDIDEMDVKTVVDTERALERVARDIEGQICTVSVHAHPISHAHGGHLHSSTIGGDDSAELRHRVVAQVLEMGIVAHSVIIGITLGTSESPCTIKPLLSALTFHQFFEGIALGSCIAQAGYRRRASALMAFFFSVTTPLGIAIGMAIASSYNGNSPKALIVQGVLDSMSTGILLYMALVDLIAADFLSKRLRCNIHLQVYSFTALFLGAGLMSLIAYWA